MSTNNECAILWPYFKLNSINNDFDRKTQKRDCNYKKHTLSVFLVPSAVSFFF